MTTIELARIVAVMREAQKSYFRTRTTIDLERSKVAERRVDKALAEVLLGPTLFPDEAGREAS